MRSQRQNGDEEYSSENNIQNDVEIHKQRNDREKSISDKQDTVQRNNICVFGVLEEEERDYRTKEVLEEIIVENFTKLKED